MNTTEICRTCGKDNIMWDDYEKCCIDCANTLKNMHYCLVCFKKLDTTDASSCGTCSESDAECSIEEITNKMMFGDDTDDDTEDTVEFE